MTKSSTARAPVRRTAASSRRCLAPRSVTLSGNSASPRLAHEMDVFDFQIAGLPRRVFEQKIDARSLAVFHFPADRRIVAQFRNQPGFECLGDELVGVAGVDADQFRPAAEIRLDEFPRQRKLAQRITGIGQPYPRQRPVEAGHRSRIGDVHGYHLAGFKHHVGEKALVAAGKRCRNQSRDELHAALKPSTTRAGKSLLIQHQAAIRPPNSSSMWARMISSNDDSA